MYLIRRVTDGALVADQHKRAGASYTRDVRIARVFRTRDAAERERCPENESVIALEDYLYIR
jgi:hypothetical protein